MTEPADDSKRQSPSPPHNPGLKTLIEGKRLWSYRPDHAEMRRGFLGWHERGYLPHFDAPNVTQFVTFVLDDAFPITRRVEWQPIMHEPDGSAKRRKLEAWLDRGHGECWLKRGEAAARLEEILRAGDGELFRLQAWVIMPNHVHLVVDVWQTPLSRLLNNWKGKSSYELNRLLGRRGGFWQHESYDTRIRDAEHLAKAVRYTEHNPQKALLVADYKTWPWSSARFRDDYNRLPWQLELGQQPARVDARHRNEADGPKDHSQPRVVVRSRGGTERGFSGRRKREA